MLAVLAGLNPLALAQAQQTGETPKSLLEFIKSSNYVNSNSGTLIGIDLDQVYSEVDHPVSFQDYQRRVAKTGSANVVILDKTMAIDDADLPNAYDRLIDSDKLNFLLATLSDANIRRLNTEGLSPNELSGQQKAALLSMMPHPLSFREGVVDGSGTRSDVNPTTLPDSDLGGVKLQLYRQLDVEFGRTQSPDGHGYGASALTSLQVRGPDGSRILISNREFGLTSEHYGHVETTTEKTSQINWNRRELSETLQVPAEITVGGAIQMIDQASKLEIYADRRVQNRQIFCFGLSITARDLLRGITYALDGAIRQVGGAYILTANVEGALSREVRMRSKMAMDDMQIAANVRKWQEAVDKRGVFEKLDFSPQDPFSPASIPAQSIAAQSNNADSMWIPLTSLPAAISSAVSQALTNAKANVAINPRGQAWNYDPSFSDKVLLRENFGYRLVLADGRPLEYHPVWPHSQNAIVNGGPPPTELPTFFNTLKVGSAVGYRSDDPGAVGSLCGRLKHFGVTELWLETQSAQALQAAIASGIKVDLVVRPWRIMRGESSSDADLNVMGLTGSQINKIQEARVDSSGTLLSTFFDTLPPGTDLTDHFERLAKLIPKTGLNRIIVLDATPGGYEKADPQNRIFGVVRDHPSLQSAVPALYKFGYTVGARLQFIRQNDVDPIDMTVPGRATLCPSPYFDQRPFSVFAAHSPVDFPSVQPLDSKVLYAWNKEHEDWCTPALNQFLSSLPLPASQVFVRRPPDPRFGGMTSRLVVQSEADDAAGRPGSVTVMTLNPVTCEDGQGNITYKPDTQLTFFEICFDLSDVPASQVDAYLHYLFKPTS